MKRGILFAATTALVLGITASSCRRPADPRQVATVDSLLTAMKAADLTLNELDTTHYATADSLLQGTRAKFLDRFNDTLDRTTAARLGAQFVQLREAARRATDHQRTRSIIADGTERLGRLRNDLLAGALTDEEALKALRDESAFAAALEQRVMQVITTHQATERALDDQPLVDSLLNVTSLAR